MIGSNRHTASRGFVEGLGALANDKPWLVRRGRYLDVAFLLEVGDVAYLVRIRRGRVEAVGTGPFVMPRWTFALRASRDAWATFWQPTGLP